MKYEDEYRIEPALGKLYNLHLENELPKDGHYWLCDWNDTADKATNLKNCEAEVKALLALSNMEIIELDIIDNYYLEDPERIKKLSGAARYFEWIPVILSFSSKKFMDYCNLVQFNPRISTANLPPVKTEVGKGFRIHKSNIISYNNQEVQLEPQIRNVAALIMQKSKNGRFTSYDEIITDCLRNSQSEQPFHDIRRIVSEARNVFKSATGRAHDFFENKRDVGYIFRP